MSLVTGIRRVGSGSAIEVSLESGERLRVDERRLLERGLAPGVELGRAPLARLREWQRIDGAEWRVLRLLARRPRSRAELAQACARCGLGSEESEALLDRLARAGLVDDAGLARRLADQRQAAGHGRLRIAHDLRRLGIDPASAVDAEDDGGGELARARAELHRRFGDPARLDRRARARAAGHLGRRGFDVDTVAEALGLDPGC
ncbi:MAG TPA: regulatory protein RecX [Gaiellales bacterium]|nr:regulatory protein RecX [Gaiellales bacterium]